MSFSGVISSFMRYKGGTPVVTPTDPGYPVPECVEVTNITQTGFDYDLECEEDTQPPQEPEYDVPASVTVTSITETGFNYQIG